MASKTIYEALGDLKEDGTSTAKGEPEGPQTATGNSVEHHNIPHDTTGDTEADDPRRIRFATYDSNRKPVPVQPPYADPYDLNRSYDEVYHEFGASSAKQELFEVLEPVRGTIDRIGIVALGPPRTGERGIFGQIALAEHAMEYLQGADPEHHLNIEMFVCEPNLIAMEIEFLGNKLSMHDVDFGQVAYDEDRRSKEYYIHVLDPDHPDRKVKVWNKSFAERGSISSMAALITTSTLLFIPNGPSGLTLRYMQATDPAIVITNPLQDLWKNVALTQEQYGFTDEGERKVWGKVWDEEWEGYWKLQEDYERLELKGFEGFADRRHHFWIYSRDSLKSRVWKTAQTGEMGLDLDIKKAVRGRLNG